MNTNKTICTYTAIIIGIIVGIAIGLLYAFGFVSTIIFPWSLLAIGIFGAFILPVYATLPRRGEGCGCFGKFKNIFFFGIIGGIISSVISLIITGVAAVATTSVVIGIAVFFTTITVISSLNLTSCLSGD